MFILNAKEVSSIGSYFKEPGWFLNEEPVTQVSLPAEGNLNYFLLIHTNHKSFNVKQSTYYFQIYPHGSATADRVLVEGGFLQKNKSKFTDLEVQPGGECR